MAELGPATEWRIEEGPDAIRFWSGGTCVGMIFPGALAALRELVSLAAIGATLTPDVVVVPRCGYFYENWNATERYPCRLPEKHRGGCGPAEVRP